MSTGLILGIESSCDETAAAVVRGGREVLSNIVSSQIAMHALYGGVVPELASREHLRNIVPVVREAMRVASASYADLDAVAVTSGPGLAGALLVGVSFAKALSFGLGKPLIAVNHLEGHIHAVLMQSQKEERSESSVTSGSMASSQPISQKRDMGHKLSRSEGTSAGAQPSFADEAVLALVVSGGHTHLYIAHFDPHTGWHYRNVGRTVDDAAGEAFDKAAKLLGLPYPGGPWMDRLAAFGNPHAVPFRFTDINRGTADEPSFDFSFSGIKTAVLRYVETHGMQPANDDRRRAFAALHAPTTEHARALCDARTLDLIASFQHAVVANLVKQAMRAAGHHGARSIVVSGGVAANRALRAAFTAAAARNGSDVRFPPPALSTDNAAMIAAAAWPRFLRGDFADAALNAAPQLRLE